MRESGRHGTIVVAVAAATRLAFILWGATGWMVEPIDSMSSRDFRAGYALDAGYGYVAGDGPARAHLDDLYRRATAGEIRVEPATAGPLPADGARPETWHPPGLPLLVAVVHRLLGIPADLPIEVIGLVLDSLAAALVFWIGRTVFSPRVGLIAGLLYGLFPPLAYWSTVARATVGLLGVFVAGVLACVVQAGRSTGRRAIGWYVAAGAVLGVGCYIRPDYFLLPVAMGAALAIVTRRPLRAAAAALVMQGVAVLVLFPWAWRNHEVCGRWVFTTTSVGATLLSGLGQFNNPWGFGATDMDRGREAAALGLPEPWVPEADLHFREVFHRSVRERPGAYAWSVLRRLPLALATPYEWGFRNPLRTQRFEQARAGGEDQYGVLRARPFYVLTAYWDRLVMSGLSLLGAIAAIVLLVVERRRLGVVLLVLSPHLYSIGAHLLTFLEPRLILPSVFAWLLAAAFVLARLGPGAARSGV